MDVKINYEYENISTFIYVPSNITFEKLINIIIEEESIEMRENEKVVLYDENNNHIKNNEDLNNYINNLSVNGVLKVEIKTKKKIDINEVNQQIERIKKWVNMAKTSDSIKRTNERYKLPPVEDKFISLKKSANLFNPKNFLKELSMEISKRDFNQSLDNKEKEKENDKDDKEKEKKEIEKDKENKEKDKKEKEKEKKDKEKEKKEKEKEKNINN